MTRRQALGALGAVTLGAYGVDAMAWERVRERMALGQQPVFFSAEQRALVTVLADMIIPRDEKSGSATDAGAVEYMEFVLSEASDTTKQAWRDVLAWFDAESNRRFQAGFAVAAEAQRAQILDEIAWPARATDALRPRAEFFNRVRDLVVAAFFSSRMGVEDLGYQGGVFNPEWRGAPPEALQQLGVSYEEWDRRYAPPPVRRRRTPGSHE